MPEFALAFALATTSMVCACWAAVAAVRYGGLWFVGFALGAILGPIGVLIAKLRIGRNCWHCWSRIHMKSRVCPFCHGDVVDRRKGKAERTGFGRRRDNDRQMRAPTDTPAASTPTA
ncbi:MAG: hypothetical protein O2782_07615 [bacterium]|nr:hypothetical protein [bacterium]